MSALRFPRTTQERRRWFADAGDVRLRRARSPLLRPAEKPFDYRCDCCDNGLSAEWDFCPYCGKIQREEPSGLCLAGLASNTACRPDDTLKRCTICGFVVDTQYAAEQPAKERGPRK